MTGNLGDVSDELLSTTELAAALLDGVPNVMFCIKDVSGRYVRVNQAFAARVGRRRAQDVLGKRAVDLFPTPLAAGYEAQDRSVLATKRPVQNQLEQITRADGRVGWYVTSKVVVLSRDDKHNVVGVASISVDLRGAVSDEHDFVGLAAAFDVVRLRYSEQLRVHDVAAAARLTDVQLERRLRRLFGVSTKQLIVRTRVENAAQLLVITSLRVAEIAAACGFYDHSQMARQFRSVIGLSPSEYRAGQ